MIAKARREHGSFARSLSRFLGLSALSGAIVASPPLRTRSARARSAAAVVSLAAVVGVVALAVPTVRAPINSVLRAPIQALGGGGAGSDEFKGYPRIVSTKLGIDILIKPGDGGLRPPVTPVAFQFPHTAPLGQPGNSYLYAHDRAGMFLGLHRASVGDVVVVELTATDRLYFQVTEIHGNVPWNDVEWLRTSNDTRVTLQTCNYSGDFDPRFVVVTKEIPAAIGRRVAGI